MEGAIKLPHPRVLDAGHDESIIEPCNNAGTSSSIRQVLGVQLSLLIKPVAAFVGKAAKAIGVGVLLLSRTSAVSGQQPQEVLALAIMHNSPHYQLLDELPASSWAPEQPNITTTTTTTATECSSLLGPFGPSGNPLPAPESSSGEANTNTTTNTTTAAESPSSSSTPGALTAAAARCWSPFSHCENYLCALMLKPCLYPRTDAAHKFMTPDLCAGVWIAAAFWDDMCDQHVWHPHYREQQMMLDRLDTCLVSVFE